MKDYKRHMAIFASLTMVIDAMGGEVMLHGKDIKKAYLDSKTDCYMVEFQNGNKEVAYDVETEMLFNNINTWRENNLVKFNSIMGI